MFQKQQRQNTLINIIIIFGLIAVALHYEWAVFAQIGDETWSVPINLSNSGGATDPTMVVDAGGSIHVIWDDKYDGWMYTRFDGQQWSEPLAVPFVFRGARPMLLADNSGIIHALWLDDNNQLLHSFVQSDNFSNPARWYGEIQLAESAVDFDAVFDEQGRLHVAYVRILDTQELPAGIYYRVSEDIGLSWTLGQLIYPSPYFRSLTQDQANIDIEASTSSQNDNIYLVWDNRSRRQVMYTRSLDAGSSWEEPLIVNSPTDDHPSARPVNIQLADSENGLLRLWQDGDPSLRCIQSFQLSIDNGSTWSDQQEMLSDITVCPQDQYFFRYGDLTMLMETLQGQVYLLAWNGSQWSVPQAQQGLSSFQDPETLDPVSFGCQVPAIDRTSDLVVVGCDTGGGGDIWLTSRPIGNVEGWFPLPSSWSTPGRVTQSSTPISSPLLLADSEGRMHAFWLQDETTTSSDTGREAIYYSVKDADTWSRPTAILRSPTGFTRQPKAAIDVSDNLYLVWSGGEAGEIYFSRASSSRANNPAEWSQPIRLPSVVLAGSSPDIQILGNGAIYVVYAIPLNEQRGIYLTASEDRGLSWSEPILAFDAVQSAWEMIDHPQIAVTDHGNIYLIFSKFSLPGGIGPMGLFATYSSDGGVTWSESEVVAENPTLWSDLIYAIGGELFRTWLVPSAGGVYFFQYQISQDQGITWGPPTSISAVGEYTALPALSRDSAGQLYLNQSALDIAKGAIIYTWLWDGTQWKLEEDLALESDNPINVEAVAAAISPQESLALIYSGSIENSGEDKLGHAIDYSERVIELLNVIPTAVPLPTNLTTITPEPTFTVSPKPTPTIMPPTVQSLDQGSGSSPSNIWAGLIFGVSLAGLIAIIVLAARILIVKRG